MVVNQAIYALEHIKQDKESTITFAPRISNLITTVVTDGNERTKLYHFYRAISPSVFKELKPSRPTNLNAAIEYCLDLERTFQPSHAGHNGSKGPGFSATAPNFLTTPVAHDVVDDPMEDIQQNAQRFNKYRHSNSNGSKNNHSSSGLGGNNFSNGSHKKRECFLCKKTEHVTRDCPFLKLASDAIKDKKGTSGYRNNA